MKALQAVSEKPTQIITVLYQEEVSAIKRTIFIYAGEDPEPFLSKAWRESAVRATVQELKTSKKEKFKPSLVKGCWE